MRLIAEIKGGDDSLLGILKSGCREETFLLVGHAVNAALPDSPYAQILTLASQYNTVLVPDEMLRSARKRRFRLIPGVLRVAADELVVMTETAPASWSSNQTGP